MKMELLRVRFDEQARDGAAEGRDGGRESGDREPQAVARGRQPAPDVASGRYQQAEFAADLWQVHLGEGSPEYRDPVEFFRRTYLTASLRELLAGASGGSRARRR